MTEARAGGAAHIGAGGAIHEEHPFATPAEDRDPVRRFRGRLAAPVTVITAGGPEARTGLTISSLVVAEGDPAHVFFLIGPDADLFDAINETGTFVVHILEDRHRHLGDRFAGLRPSPGGLFAGLDVVDGRYGPELADLATRLYCRHESGTEYTVHVLESGIVEESAVHELVEPLVYFRGRYRRLQ